MVRQAKGPRRPIVPEIERFDLINNLSVVSAAFVLRGLSELSSIVVRFEVRKVFKHESFWDIENVAGVTGTGAELVIVPDIPGMVSTSKLIERIVGRYGGAK
jgi:bifunctional ADP-heptose synthase (sugar kinase/adenylyltransferase)